MKNETIHSNEQCMRNNAQVMKNDTTNVAMYNIADGHGEIKR